MGDYTGSSALRIALYLGAIPLCMGKVGKVGVVHDWDCDGDNSTLFSFIIYLYHRQMWTNVTRRLRCAGGKRLTKPLQCQEDQKFTQGPGDPLLAVSSPVETQAQHAISTLMLQNK